MRLQQSVNNHYDCPREVTEYTFSHTCLTLGPCFEGVPRGTKLQKTCSESSGNGKAKIYCCPLNSYITSSSPFLNVSSWLL